MRTWPGPWSRQPWSTAKQHHYHHHHDHHHQQQTTTAITTTGMCNIRTWLGSSVFHVDAPGLNCTSDCVRSGACSRGSGPSRGPSFAPPLPPRAATVASANRRTASARFPPPPLARACTQNATSGILRHYALSGDSRHASEWTHSLQQKQCHSSGNSAGHRGTG
jgi:hypothetical protein